MTARPSHYLNGGGPFSTADGDAPVYNKTDKTRRRGLSLSRRWAVMSQRKKAGTLVALGFGVLVLYFLVSFYRAIMQDDVLIVTSTEDLPLVTVERNFLAKDEYHKLMEQVANHPKLTPHGLPKGDLGSKGIHIHFNMAGIQRLKEDPDVAMFFPIFQRVRWVDANFWKLNFFFVETADGMVPESGVWGVHHDVLLGSWMSGTDGLNLGPGPGVQQYSHVTTLLYLDFPPDMHGGNLWVWDPSADPLAEDGEPPAPAAVMLPHRNSLLQFRGDAYHGVSAHNTSTAIPRVSLVFEQFKVPTWLYGRSWEWLPRVYRNQYPLKTLATNGAPFTPTTPAQRAAAQKLLRSPLNMAV